MKLENGGVFGNFTKVASLYSCRPPGILFSEKALH